MAESVAPQPSRYGKVAFILGFTGIAIAVVFGCVLPIGALKLGDHTDVDPSITSIAFGLVAPIGFLSIPVLNFVGIGLFVVNTQHIGPITEPRG